MIDIVFPQNNEQEFLKTAERLKIQNICFVYPKPTEISQKFLQTKIKIFTGVHCKPAEVQKYKGRFLTFVEAPEDQAEIRHIIENMRPHVLFNLEFHKRADFIHHRASGLNHILANIAKQRNVAVGLNFSGILNARPLKRAAYIGRMIQNIRFARKFKFKTIISSFASSHWHMRAESDLQSFFMCMGMTARECKTALNLELKR